MAVQPSQKMHRLEKQGADGIKLSGKAMTVNPGSVCPEPVFRQCRLCGHVIMGHKKREIRQGDGIDAKKFFSLVNDIAKLP